MAQNGECTPKRDKDASDRVGISAVSHICETNEYFLSAGQSLTEKPSKERYERNETKRYADVQQSSPLNTDDGTTYD